MVNESGGGSLLTGAAEEEHSPGDRRYEPEAMLRANAGSLRAVARECAPQRALALWKKIGHDSLAKSCPYLFLNPEKEGIEPSRRD